MTLRGQDVLVITPAGKRRVDRAAQGRPRATARPAEETAAREVREETGVTVSVREFLGDVEYWYRRGGRRVFKTVRFYLCDFVSGSTEDHDHEVDERPLDPARRGASTGSATPASGALIESVLSKRASGR